jgi:hypothetical protein
LRGERSARRIVVAERVEVARISGGCLAHRRTTPDPVNRCPRKTNKGGVNLKGPRDSTRTIPPQDGELNPRLKMKQIPSSPAEKIAKSAASSRRAPSSTKTPAPAAAVETAARSKSASFTAALDLHTVRIGFFQPEAREVYVAGSFNDWDPRETPLLRDSLGDWSVELSLPPGEHRYRLVVDGEWRDDPSAQRMEANPFGGFDAVIAV